MSTCFSALAMANTQRMVARMKDDIWSWSLFEGPSISSG